MRGPLFCISLLVCSVLQAAPPPGHPTTEQAAGMMGIGASSKLSYRGEVLEAIDSNSYTYIRVTTADHQGQWLAAPRLTLQPGQVISYPDGVLMRNFYSKKHRRMFDLVLFVSEVVPVP